MLKARLNLDSAIGLRLKYPMAELEQRQFITIQNFSKDGIIPERKERDPVQIILNTYRNIELKCGGDLDTKLIDDSLRSVTLPYLSFVSEAASEYFDPFRSHVHATSLVLDKDSWNLTREGQARASVDFFALVFGSLPDMFTHPQLPPGYWRKEELRPPASSLEMVDRVNEVSEVVEGFISGENDVNDLRLKKHNKHVIRGLAFLKVGARMPLVVQSRGEIRDSMSQFISGLEFDLPDGAGDKSDIEEPTRAKNLYDERLRRLLDGIEIDLNNTDKEDGLTA